MMYIFQFSVRNEKNFYEFAPGKSFFLINLLPRLSFSYYYQSLINSYEIQDILMYFTVLTHLIFEVDD